jgi:hypothetical protein
MLESSSLNEVPKCGQSPSRHWVIPGVLFFVYAGLGVVLNPARVSSSLHDVGLPSLVSGFLFSQPLLLAFWTAFARQRFSHRVLWGLPLCVGIALAAEVGGLLAGDSTPRWDRVFVPRGYFLSMDLILFCVMTPVLLLVRGLSRWTLAPVGTETASSSYRARQYGIKHLIVLTVIAAVVCSLFRSLTIVDPSASIQPVAEVARIVLRVVTLLLPVALIPWFTLGNRWHRLAAILTIAVVLLLSRLAFFFLVPNVQTPVPLSATLMQLGASLVPYAQTQVLLPATLIQLGAGLSLFFSTLVMRRCGFRMVRLERNAAVPVQ